MLGFVMRRYWFNVLGGALVVAWVSVLGAGASKLWRYENTAGAGAVAPRVWPADSGVARDARLPTLVMLVHPQCPCSRASIGELARLMAHCEGRVRAAVLFVRPEGAAAGWEKSGLWADAAAIPGVTVLTDDQGRESQRFGAATSGQALLYGADGRLLFAGGITESRGHSGDNAGESAIQAMVLSPALQGRPEEAVTPVYGCPLFSEQAASPKKGCPVCRQ
jgi:hypothetical protein